MHDMTVVTYVTMNSANVMSVMLCCHCSYLKIKNEDDCLFKYRKNRVMPLYFVLFYSERYSGVGTVVEILHCIEAVALPKN